MHVGWMRGHCLGVFSQCLKETARCTEDIRREPPAGKLPGAAKLESWARSALVGLQIWRMDRYHRAAFPSKASKFSPRQNHTSQAQVTQPSFCFSTPGWFPCQRTGALLCFCSSVPSRVCSGALSLVQPPLLRQT